MRDYLKKICEANNNTHSVEDTYENVKIEAELILAVCITVDLDVVWHFTLMFTLVVVAESIWPEWFTQSL